MNPIKYLASTAAAAYLALAGTPALADTMLPDGLACIEYSQERNKAGANVITVPVFAENYPKLEAMLDDETLYHNPLTIKKVSRAEVEAAYLKRHGQDEPEHQLDDDEVCAEITLPQDLSVKLDAQRALSQKYLSEKESVEKQLVELTKLHESLRDAYVAKKEAEQDDGSFTAFDLSYSLLANSNVTLHDVSLGYTVQNSAGLFFKLEAGIRIPAQDPQVGEKKLTEHMITRHDGDVTERTDYSTSSSEEKDPSFIMGADIGGSYSLGGDFSLVGSIGVRANLGERETSSTIDRVISLNSEQQEELTAKGKDGKDTVWSFEVPIGFGLVYSIDEDNNISLILNLVPTANNSNHGDILGGVNLGYQHKY